MPSRKAAIAAAKPLASAHAHSHDKCASPAPGEKTNGRMHKRSRSGCYTCRVRRKKCDETPGRCKACRKLGLECHYKRPHWWAVPAERRRQAEHIKGAIKLKKNQERNGNNPGQLNSLSGGSSSSPMHDYGRPMYHESYDSFASQLPTPGLGSAPYGPYVPYEVDVRTERQTFINDVPLRHDLSTSTYSAFAPPQISAPMPVYAGDQWFGDECFAQAMPYDGFNQGVVDPRMGYLQTSPLYDLDISHEDRDLLDHFMQNVLHELFPVLEAYENGAWGFEAQQKRQTRQESIINSLKTNKSYLSCCLSVAAIHRKTCYGSDDERSLDSEIMRHRYEAISQLCSALGEDEKHEEILDATLAMILFHCQVGPVKDHLPDIPWFEHFQAASNLVTRLGLPNASVLDVNQQTTAPFNMRLTWWIDILGSTMLGNTPQFANDYRTKYITGERSSDLRELMGCKDRVMYLISEITCLDSLKSAGRLTDESICKHVEHLGEELTKTEMGEQAPISGNIFDPVTGKIIPEALTEIITRLFRTAARIYLCSLVPGFDRNEETIVRLVNTVVALLELIPHGPNGYDRSLVWPILIAGVFSIPDREARMKGTEVLEASTFRKALGLRAAKLGGYGDLGSFGRMYRLLVEVWRLTDPHDDGKFDQISSGSGDYNSSLTSPISRLDGSHSPSGAGATLGGREIKKQEVHWRDVMKRNNWHYLLM